MNRPLLALAVLSSVPTTALSQITLECVATGITVEAPQQQEAEITCELVSRADRRLNDLGLSNRGSLAVVVTEQLSFAANYCVAYYDADANRMEVLSERCLEERPPRTSAFPDMSPDVLFESLIFHELTHAYVDAALDGRPLPRAAHEYLAYAVQVDSLPDEVQANFLEEAGVESPVSIEELNEAMLFMAPMRFAATAYLYFQQNGGDAGAVTRVLTWQDRFYRYDE